MREGEIRLTRDVYTLQEAAEHLRVPYRTVRDAVFAGRWPHVKLSPRKRVMTRDDLTAVLQMSHRAVNAEATSATKARKARVLDLLDAA